MFVRRVLEFKFIVQYGLTRPLDSKNHRDSCNSPSSLLIKHFIYMVFHFHLIYVIIFCVTIMLQVNNTKEKLNKEPKKKIYDSYIYPPKRENRITRVMYDMIPLYFE